MRAIDERKLLVRTGRGHGKSASLLWGFYAPRLIAYARTLLASQGAQAHAEDVVQIAMCKVLQTSPARLRKVEAVGPWLYTIVRTSSLNHMRGERREMKRRTHAKPPNEMGPPSSYETLRRAVEALPSDEAEVVSLRHAGGLTFDQIAEVLAIPRSTAASRHSRALDRLREALTEPDAPLKFVEGVRHAK
ncbi:MAG: sigma-70 family RNA polymerase sigma factor [Phycisphaera sp.]|nr:MAG: sigma-70 family RNA polymerase sigma factor [Phycisphaera sp.]